MASVRERLNARRAQRNGSTPAPTPEPAPREREVEAPPVQPRPQTDDRQKAPWHYEGCGSCKDNPVLGFNSKGKPCRVCLVRMRSTGIRAEHYDTVLEDGKLTLIHNETGNELTYNWPGQTEAPEKVAPAPAPEPKKQEEPAPEPEPKKKAKKKVKKKSASAPAPEAPSQAPADLGFALFINCVPTKVPVPQPTVSLADLMRKHGAELAEAAGRSSFYELDAFKRRDALCAMVGSMGLVNCTVVAHPQTPDEKALVAALETAAGFVVRGTL